MDDDSARGEAAGDAKSSGRLARIGVYVSFMIVGNGCGWFVPNSIWQTLANVPEITQDGRMFGKVTIIIGAVGLAVAFLYSLTLIKGPMTKQTGQRLSSLLIASTMAAFLSLMLFWDAGAPEYPVFIAATVFGSAIAAATYFVLFPMVSTFYGGWLVAPVRAGTDLSSLVTSLLAEAQNPTGTHNLFPMWVLYATYTAMSFCGLAAWMVILKFGIGLRDGTEMELSDEQGLDQAVQQQQQQQQQQQHQNGQQRRSQEGAQGDLRDDAELEDGAGNDAGRCTAEAAKPEVRQQLPLVDRLRQLLGSLACPRSLIAPISCAVLSQVLQWSLVACIAQIGATMTDPEGCDGAAGKQAYRIALTLSSIFVPAGSALSSYAECPRWAFYSLSVFQLVATVLVVLATAGVAQDVWFTPAARAMYIACVAIVAGSEGYLLTMAYRYIGDNNKLPAHMRLSASSLLSFLSVVAVNPASIAIGILVDDGSIVCK